MELDKPETLWDSQINIEEMMESMPRYDTSFDQMWSRDNHSADSNSQSRPKRPVISPYVNGRMVLIDRATRGIDTLMLDLPDDLRASSPHQVGTVVWLDWDARQEGVYVSSRTGKRCGGAFRRSCDVAVIDCRNGPKLVGRKRVLGPEPPHKTDSESDVYGKHPRREIVESLASLPRN